tara:strand:+ start:51 stop:1106 length:1056 start_codon:yes stop_codon:yes gene_type:complete
VKVKYFFKKNIFKLIILFVLFLIVSSCAKNTYHATTKFGDLEKKEAINQKKFLIKEMSKASLILHKISWPILVNNKNKCKASKSFSFGFLFADILDLPVEDHFLYLNLYNNSIDKKKFKEYNTKSFPIVLSVAKNSPAEKSGLKANDIILSINEKNTKSFRKKLDLIIKKTPNLYFKILREGEVQDIKLVGKRTCIYNVQPIPSGAPNAYADGDKVFITMAAIKLANTYDELAFLIGHEIAHNILHFESFNTTEAYTFAINYTDKPKIRNIKNLFVWSDEKREIEADIEGVKLAFYGGYSLKNVNDYWRRLSVFNPSLINKSKSIYMSNAFRASLINETLKELKKIENGKK